MWQCFNTSNDQPHIYLAVSVWPAFLKCCPRQYSTFPRKALFKTPDISKMLHVMMQARAAKGKNNFGHFLYKSGKLSRTVIFVF